MDRAYAASLRAGGAGRPLLALRHRRLGQPERGLRPGPGRHVPAGQDDSQGRHAAGRMPRGPLQARVRHGRNRRPPNRPSGCRQAEAWCRAVRGEQPQVAEDRRWPASSADGEPEISYEDVDTSLIPPRPRLYGVVGGEVIEEVWNERQAPRRSVAADEQRTNSASTDDTPRRRQQFGVRILRQDGPGQPSYWSGSWSGTSRT